MSDEFITIARVLKPQGRRGEVVVELFTSFPERFADRRRVLALEAGGSRRELQVEDFWAHKGRMVLKFAGVESISDAELLKGCEIQVPAAERTPLAEGESYVSDLVGCAVFVETQPATPAREIGGIANVTFGAGEAPLLVIRGPQKEYEVPFAAEYIVHLDIAGKRLTMRLPEGMLELDAPLSREEKDIQHRED